MSVGTASASVSTFFKASINREVSPPEAILTSGFKPSPGLGAIKNSQRSTPFSSKLTGLPGITSIPFASGSVCKSTAKRAPPIFKSASSTSTACPSLTAACCRSAERVCAWAVSRARRSVIWLCSSAMRSAEWVMASNCWRASTALARAPSMLPPYLRFRSWMSASRSSRASNLRGLASICSR